MTKPRICVDFDGTIFDGAKLLAGCVEVLSKLREKYRIAIFSSRPTEAERKQMTDILNTNGVPYDEILPAKPDAMFYIDDKGVEFQGWYSVLAKLR